MSDNRNLVKRYREINLGEVSLPICFHHSKGNYLYDIEGNAFLDFTSGYGVTNSGWLRKEIVDSIQEQLLRSAYAPPWIPTQESIELSELLLEITPPNLVYCARAVSGADANEVIYKAVFASNGKKGVISFSRSYHGGTHFTLNLSDVEKFHLPKLPIGSEFYFVEPPYCYRCPFGKEPNSCNLECIEPIEKLIEKEKNIGSFFLEPVIGSGGVIIPPQKYLSRLRELCTQYNIFLVFDEVLTGFGRLGALTASKLFDIQPDAISFAKGMSSGYTAIGAAVLNAELSNSMKKFEDVSSTFAWTPLSCCITKTNINLIIKENLSANANIEGLYLLQSVNKLFKQYLPSNLGEIRGVGLMIGIELVKDTDSKTPNKRLSQMFIIESFRNGLMICASWDFQVIILMPPLNITRQEINEGLNKLELTLKNLVLSHLK